MAEEELNKAFLICASLLIIELGERGNLPSSCCQWNLLKLEIRGNSTVVLGVNFFHLDNGLGYVLPCAMSIVSHF